MKTEVKVSTQVSAYVRSLAPEPRKALTRAIKSLANARGEVSPLEGNLAGFCRLRVSGHRVIYAERHEAGRRIIDCVFAEKRAVVYELFIRLRAEEAGS